MAGPKPAVLPITPRGINREFSKVSLASKEDLCGTSRVRSGPPNCQFLFDRKAPSEITGKPGSICRYESVSPKKPLVGDMLQSSLNAEGQTLQFAGEIHVDHGNTRGQPESGRRKVQDSTHPGLDEPHSGFRGMFSGNGENRELGRFLTQAIFQFGDVADGDSSDRNANSSGVVVEGHRVR